MSETYTEVTTQHMNATTIAVACGYVNIKYILLEDWTSKHPMHRTPCMHRTKVHLPMHNIGKLLSSVHTAREDSLWTGMSAPTPYNCTRTGLKGVGLTTVGEKDVQWYKKKQGASSNHNKRKQEPSKLKEGK